MLTGIIHINESSEVACEFLRVCKDLEVIGFEIYCLRVLGRVWE